jgi:DNA invertase Pin-like site-specific DNA recombinase
MLTVLGGLAEFEREMIRARTGEGRKRAMARASSLAGQGVLDTHQRRKLLSGSPRAKKAKLR